MAVSCHNNIAVSPQTPPAEVLTSLVRRLRSHVRAIHNAPARQTVGKDMRAAADVIEQQVLYRDLDAVDLVAALPANEAWALARMAKRFLYEDAVRFANRHDGGAERDALLGGIGKLRSALAGAGFAPR
jgi:hypothetical protein